MFHFILFSWFRSSNLSNAYISQSLVWDFIDENAQKEKIMETSAAILHSTVVQTFGTRSLFLTC